MSKHMTIENVSTSDLAKIVAGLVQQGLTFKAFQISDGVWHIELLGGF